MSNNTAPDKSITDEIVDGLAKNYTELEKKYIDLEKRQAKTEGLGETVNALIPKVKTLEVSAASYPKVYVPDYSKEFAQVREQFKHFNQAYDQAVQHLEEKIKAMPKVLPVKNYHDFDPKSKPVVRTLIAMGITIAILSGLCMDLGIKYHSTTDEVDKFLILRGFYPDIAKAIDGAYANDADKLIKKAEANIDEQQTMSQAAFAAKQAAQGKAAGEGKKQTGNGSARRKTQNHKP